MIPSVALLLLYLIGWFDHLARSTERHAGKMAMAHNGKSEQSCSIFVLRLALVMSLLVSRVTCTVTIRNWTTRTAVVVTAIPRGAAEDLLPSQWIEYTITSNEGSAMFTVATNKPDNKVVTVLLYDGQEVALVDNMRDSIDGILVDDKGNKIQTLFINLWRFAKGSHTCGFSKFHVQ